MTLGDRLRELRHIRFVGRDEERALFREAIASRPLPFHVLHVFGPGGSGKTTLLREFERYCREESVPVSYLDARFVAPAPEALEDAVDRARENTDGRSVLLIDTYETMAALDGWIRRSFLPRMPEDLLFVLAGRNRPDSNWLADPGWREAVRMLPLRNLTPEESLAFLAARDVPEEQYDQVLAFTHGHPLALALAAEHVRQDPTTLFSLDEAPDVVKALLQRFVVEAPSRTHRAALEASALVRALTEPFLCAIIDEQDAHVAFSWLRSLPFIQEGPGGLFPHDIARDVIAADLLWRDSERYNVYHERARKFCMYLLRESTTDEERREAIGSYVFLYRANPIVRPILGTLREEWEKAGDRMVDTLDDDDIPVLRLMTERHEGEESARLAERWLQERPGSVQVFRDEAEHAAGFLMTLELQECTPEERRSDPALEAAWRYLKEYAPLRSDDRAVVFRYWMDENAHQQISAVQSLIFSSMVQCYVTTPRLAFSFLPCADGEFWSTIFAFARVHRIPEADYEVGGRRFAVFGHDWRAEPVETWMEVLASNAPTLVPSQNERVERPALIFLSEPDFAEAVHDALRCFAKPHELESNPLLRSRLVEERAGADAETPERIETLKGLVLAAARTMADAPKEERYYRAIQATYLKPAPSQALAAERLDVPFSTFRRHLSRGIEHVTGVLWRQETA